MSRTVDHDVIVIGAGISGLAAAHWLRRDGHTVLVLEKDSEPGGTMKTVSEDGYLIETGPNSALETTPLIRDLVDSCGLTDDMRYADPVGKNRFILRNGALHALPLSPLAFVRSRLFTLRGKMRLLAEPFIGRADREESVADFVSRRLGSEFLDYAIDPFVAGVFAGKPQQLSVRSAFPKLYALEEKYGGLVRGMIGGARERRQREEKAKDRAESFSFLSGMQAMPRALAASLGDSLRLSASVRSVIRRDGIYDVATGPGEQDVIRARAVVVATPAFHAAELLGPEHSAAAGTLRSIEYSPVASVFMGYRRSDVDHPLNGFGLLIPSKEGRRILGTLWSSSLFGNRAPDGYAAFTVFVGGARQPEHLTGNDEDLVRLCSDELSATMHILGKPVYYRVTRWEKAIPQYTIGYSRTVEALESFQRGLPGLALCSNYIGGISVGDCVMSARRTADTICSYLRSAAA